MYMSEVFEIDKVKMKSTEVQNPVQHKRHFHRACSHDQRPRLILTASIEALPDSRANISAAESEILGQLGERADNLLPSMMIPGVINGTRMKSVGRLPVILTLEEHTHDLRIYPEVTGMLLSSTTPKKYIQPQ